MNATNHSCTLAVLLIMLASIVTFSGNAVACPASGGTAVRGNEGLASAAHAETKGEPQTLCPILGNKISKSSYLDYEGTRVYFCCDGCKKEFLKDPKKHIRAMESKGIVLEKAPQGSLNPSHPHGAGEAL